MLYLPIGIPGSGKSTLVRSHFSESEIVCPDEIREWLTDDVNNQSVNKSVFNIVDRVVYERLHHNLDVVVDATNLRPELWPYDEGRGTTLIIMNTNKARCFGQNEMRERVVPEHVLDRMWFSYESVLARWMSGEFDHCKVQWSDVGFTR